MRTFFAHRSFFLQLLLIAHVFCNLLLAQLALKIGNDLFNLFTFYNIFLSSFHGALVSWAPTFPSRVAKSRVPCRGTISTGHNQALHSACESIGLLLNRYRSRFL